jgi:hypothetical protein
MDHCRHEIKNLCLRRIRKQVFPETPLHPQLFRLQYHNGYFRRHQQQDQTAIPHGIRLQGRPLLLAQDPSALRGA